MAVQQSSPQVDLGGRALLLAPDGDVVLLDLTGVAPDEVGPRVASQRSGGGPPVGARVSGRDAVDAALAAGAALVHVDAVLAAELVADPPDRRPPPGGPALAAPADGAGPVVVVAGEGAAARRAGLGLLAWGIAPGRVVVEVPVGVAAAVVTAGGVASLAAEGLVAGAVLPPVDGSTDEAAGWEVGLTMALLSAGVGTIRGAGAVRFRRTRAVFEALAAAEPSGPAEAGGAGGATP